MLKVALIGRPNVGKSTLFNRLTSSRDAIVADEAGLTRDRHYGCAESDGCRWLLIDTGGLAGGAHNTDVAIAAQVAVQAEWAIAEADLVCFVTSARDGLIGADETVVGQLRRAGKPVWLVVNKVDGCGEHTATEFASLGLAPCFQTAATHGRSIDTLRGALAEYAAGHSDDFEALDEYASEGLRVTFLGRPNVGKSTLVNRLLGEERVLTNSAPGTTRDSIAVSFIFGGERFVLVDTAGVRQRSKVSRKVETFSALKTFENMMLSDVVVLVCDVADGITTQDKALAARALSAGRALVVALNKRDLIADARVRYRFERSRALDLRFLRGVEALEISALFNRGMKCLMRAIRRAHESAHVRIATPQCTRLLKSAVEQNQPPVVSGGRVKLRYAHQGGTCPPRFIIYGSRVDGLTASYRRYLENFFRRQLNLVGTPMVFEFRRTPNRFAPS